MEIVLLILVIAAIVGGVVLNKRASARALEGVEFAVEASAENVARALVDAYCTGGMAAAKRTLSGVTVSPVGPSSFRAVSRLGDVGDVCVLPAGPGGSTIRARTEELYVGSHPASHFRGGIYGTGARLNHKIFLLLGISPGASRMVRFQNGLEGRLHKQLRRTSST